VIPVIAPVAISREGETLNVNADTFASALAARMKAKRLLLLTDVAGVLDGQGNLIQQLSIAEARRLIREGVISGGMIPKGAKNPDVAKEFARYWDMLHRGGTVPHEIKELARIQIAQIVGCEFCARQTSPLASSITEEEKRSCALPNWEHPDPKTRAALHYARTLTLDDGRDKEVYAELKKFYSNAEIIELSAFFCLTAGGNRMAKSWSIEAHGEVPAIPSGAMSIHGNAEQPSSSHSSNGR
jgi:alkylhydroperoxidase family enzyme